MSKYYTLVEVDSPTEAEMSERREKIHADHLDYFYGNHWNIFIDKENKCFLEFDVGHLASKFIVKEISRKDYDSLKTDTSLFDKISRVLC
jgi:hypothetical protein